MNGAKTGSAAGHPAARPEALPLFLQDEFSPRPFYT